MTVNRQTFFDIMASFPSGVAIVTTLDSDGTPRGLTTTAVASVSADPPLLLSAALTCRRGVGMAHRATESHVLVPRSRGLG